MTLLFAGLFYLAGAFFFVGLAYKLYRYIKTPQPLPVLLMPAPKSLFGVAGRILCEVVLFRSLFKASLQTWIFAWVFHAAFVIVVLRHLHYFVERPALWMYQIQSYSSAASVLMMIGLAGLWARRLFVDRIRYISAPSDHLMLALILAIGVSGMAMKHTGVDMVGVKYFILGIIQFDLQPIPANGLVYIHFVLVAVLITVFPISKLIHAPGIFLNPALTQRDQSRE